MNYVATKSSTQTSMIHVTLKKERERERIAPEFRFFVRFWL